MRLLEPITIRGMQLRNRIVMPAMQVFIGIRGRRARAYYAERARGGVAAIIVAPISVDLFVRDEAWGQPGAVASFVDGLRALTAAVHDAGGKLGLQLWHGNRFPAGIGEAVDSPNTDVPGERVAPSAKDDMRQLSLDEIRSVVTQFAIAAVRCQEAGFDFIELHGAHGYLLCQFFSPIDNQRTDKYGGDLSRRMRLGLECVTAVRRAVGEDYPLFFRLAAEEKRAGGISLANSIDYALELQSAGVDVLNVSIGAGDFADWVPPKKSPEGTFVPQAAAIKSKVRVPVIAVGRIHRVELAESILAQGKADLVALGRQSIADPFWPQKVMEGRTQEIIACDSCNTSCVTGLIEAMASGKSLCRHNDRAGKEWEIPLPGDQP
jgi:2,4-dienoyl-CoA reductase-like NADH-dependent reductase (Old Yellow Enzyme family)